MNQNSRDTVTRTEPASKILAEEKERTVTIEETSKKNAHILTSGDSLCSHKLGETTPIDGELPKRGLCNRCKQRLEIVEVVSVDEVVSLLPESADIESLCEHHAEEDGGE
jgi:hypothetical protein